MAKKSKPIITVCASCAFYRKVNEVKDTLDPLGFEVLVPRLALEMKRTGNYEVSQYKTWFADPNDYDKKADLIRAHFAEIDKADAILVVNEEKRGIKNYIGGNVLMEMALAFHTNKPVFILNEVPEGSSVEEEIRGVLPILLHGKVKDLPAAWARITGESKLLAFGADVGAAAGDAKFDDGGAAARTGLTLAAEDASEA